MFPVLVLPSHQAPVKVEMEETPSTRFPIATTPWNVEEP
jgi:hypothetical protein